MRTATRTSRCRVSRPIGQALSADALEQFCCTRLVVESEFLAVVVAKIVFVHVALKMLFADVLVNPFKAALHDRKETLDRIGMHIAAHVLFQAVRDGAVGFRYR